MNNPTLTELRTMLRFHSEMASMYEAQGATSKARAARRRAETVRHSLSHARRGSPARIAWS
jgi:hypothetical protein